MIAKQPHLCHFSIVDLVLAVISNKLSGFTDIIQYKSIFYMWRLRPPSPSAL